MSNIDSTEVSASTVEEATREALEQLGVSEEEATVEVLSTPRAGVLGLGARQARVRVTRNSSRGEQTQQRPAGASSGDSSPARERGSSRSAAAGDDTGAGGRVGAGADAQSREAIAILKQILGLMGEQTDVRQNEVDGETVELEIRGDGSGILIGRHGQTLDALEYVVNRILARRIKDAAPVSLETESYRARRRQQLHRMALSMGERAKRDHQAVRLDPMPPRDRRVVHLALKDDPMITTRSAGEGFLRSIEILPTDGGRRERGDGQGQGQPRGQGQGRGRRRERERDSKSGEQQQPERGNEALGEQGGFKHGQKRIV